MGYKGETQYQGSWCSSISEPTINEPSIQWMDGALVGAGSLWQLVMKELLVVCTLLVQGLARDNETSTMGKVYNIHNQPSSVILYTMGSYKMTSWDLFLLLFGYSPPIMLFLGSILSCSQSGDCQLEDLAKFGYKINRKAFLKNFLLLIFWLSTWTMYRNLEIFSQILVGFWLLKILKKQHSILALLILNLICVFGFFCFQVCCLLLLLFFFFYTHDFCVL